MALDSDYYLRCVRPGSAPIYVMFRMVLEIYSRSPKGYNSPMRSDQSTPGRKRKSNSTTKILGLILLGLVVVLAGLFAAVMIINRIAEPWLGSL